MIHERTLPTGSNKLTFSDAAEASLNSARRASFGIRQQTWSKGKRAGEVVKLVALSLALVAGKEAEGPSTNDVHPEEGGGLAEELSYTVVHQLVG